jgi:PAS domain S-box-containing protein
LNHTGYSAKEVIGRNASLLKSGLTPQSTFENLWQSLKQGKNWKGEFINRSRDGELQINFAHVLPLRQSDGQITNYVSIQEDITEKKRQGEELNRYRHRLEELVEERTAQLLEANAVLSNHHAEIAELYNDAPCGYHSLNAAGRFISINDTELVWLGYERDAVEKQLSFSQVIAEHDLPIFEANFALLLDSSVVTVAEYDMVRRDGSLLPVLINSRPVRDA